MAVTTPVKPRISALERLGTLLTYLVALGLSGGLSYWFTGAFGRAVTQDQLKTTLTDYVIGAVTVALLALVTSILTLPRIIGHARPGRSFAAFFSVATLAGSLAFLFVTVLPHAQLAQFAVTMQAKCQTPLNAITDKHTGDIAKARDAATLDASDDQQFATDMQHYADIFQQDSQKATDAAHALDTVTPFSDTYKPLIADCKTEFLSAAHFLTGADGVTLPRTLPPPFGGAEGSAADLLKQAAQLVNGKYPGVPQPISASIVSQIVAGVLDTAVNTCDTACHRLTDSGGEADQLKSNAFGPFKTQGS